MSEMKWFRYVWNMSEAEIYNIIFNVDTAHIILLLYHTLPGPSPPHRLYTIQCNRLTDYLELHQQLM